MKKIFKMISALSLAAVMSFVGFAPSSTTAAEQNLNLETEISIHDDIIIPFNQLLVPHEDISASNGFWERTFSTAGTTQGNRLNIFFRNDTGSIATVRVERRSGSTWVLVRSMTVSANSSNTVQATSITLNAEHRVTVQGASGARVAGEIGIRQTNQALN